MPDVLEEAYEEVDAGDRAIDEVALAGKLHEVIANSGRELEPGERQGIFAVIEGLRFRALFEGLRYRVEIRKSPQPRRPGVGYALATS